MYGTESHCALLALASGRAHLAWLLSMALLHARRMQRNPARWTSATYQIRLMHRTVLRYYC
ncbi:hypothetical protein D918_06587 [Trichuris suis]|nr:hypothetical protein D918_06587 [Trichuris suis]